MPNYDRAAVIANALQYINDPAQRAKLEGELASLRTRRPWSSSPALVDLNHPSMRRND